MFESSIFSTAVTGFIVSLILLVIEYWTGFFASRGKGDFTLSIHSGKLVWYGPHTETLVRVRLKNTGSVPIRREDFDEPIQIMFYDVYGTPKIYISHIEINARRPLDLNVQPFVNQNVVYIPETLFNVNDFLILDIYLDRVYSISWLIRIAGISDVTVLQEISKEEYEEKIESASVRLISALIFTVGLFIFSVEIFIPYLDVIQRILFIYFAIELLYHFYLRVKVKQAF